MPISMLLCALSGLWRSPGINRPTPADVYAYEGYLRSRKYSDFTKNLYLHLLKRYFAFLEQHIDLETGRTVRIYPNICKGIKIIVKRPPREPVRNSLTDRDVKKAQSIPQGPLKAAGRAGSAYDRACSVQRPPRL